MACMAAFGFQEIKAKANDWQSGIGADINLGLERNRRKKN